jgi:hypothetical protein
MKTKIFCVVESESNNIIAAYSQFETAMNMAKAYYGVSDLQHSIKTVDFDFIDFNTIAKHVEKKVLDRRRSS